MNNTKQYLDNLTQGLNNNFDEAIEMQIDQSFPSPSLAEINPDTDSLQEKMDQQGIIVSIESKFDNF